MSVDIEALEDVNEQRRDFRRSNGAPMVSDPEDPAKWQRYSCPSGYSKCLDDEAALESWRIFKAMTGVARSQALAAEVNACKDEDRVEKEALRNKALDKGTANEAADMGHALHAMTARAEDAGDVDFDPPEQYVADLDTYRDALATYGLVSEMVEVPFVNDLYRAAGTADRVYRTTLPLVAPDGMHVEPGTLIIGDLKTGKKLDFSMQNFCVQMFLYASGKLYDIHAERRLATPPIDQSWTLLVHLPVGKARCDVLWCSMEVGRIGASLSREVREWRKNWKNGTFDCPAVGVPDILQPMVGQAEERFALLDRLHEELGGTVTGEPSLQTMSDWCQERINQIAKYEVAKRHLIMFWPEGLPTPKKGIVNDAQMVLLLNYLDSVEKQFSLPFLEDPRTAVISAKAVSERFG